MTSVEPGDTPHGLKSCSLGEEIANSITHGLGTGLSVAGLTVLV